MPFDPRHVKKFFEQQRPQAQIYVVYESYQIGHFGERVQNDIAQ